MSFAILKLHPSLERGLFWLTIYPGADPELIDVSAAATRYGSWFLELRPRAGKDAHYKAILMLFPDLPAARAPELIDTVQAALKPAFTARRWLMLSSIPITRLSTPTWTAVPTEATVSQRAAVAPPWRMP